MLWIENKWLYLQKFAGKLEKTFQIRNMVGGRGKVLCLLYLVAEVSALCTWD